MDPEESQMPTPTLAALANCAHRYRTLVQAHAFDRPAADPQDLLQVGTELDELLRLVLFPVSSDTSWDFGDPLPAKGDKS
jgi:hypothetical protein